MIPLTEEENESYEKQKIFYICKKEFSTHEFDTDENDKNEFNIDENEFNNDENDYNALKLYVIDKIINYI